MDERGHEVSWCERRGCRGQMAMEAEDLLWRPLKEKPERKRRRIKLYTNKLTKLG